MRAVVQRVSRASVRVASEDVGRIGKGLLVLLGAGQGDGPTEVDWMVEKITGLRIFEDDDGKMNLSLAEVGGALLVVSQFTLYGDCRKGRRPSFVHALEPIAAEELVQRFIDTARTRGFHVESGRFRATMDVELTNEGPVTLIIESPAR